MIPNVFISSTVADLHYLRDALRDAILELRYHPVMSEYGEVGYIRPSTAADACYRTVEQCQMVILIVGKRYGSVGSDGLSVTHKEYQAANASGIPTITLVEQQVLHYKEVYDSSPKSKLWKEFPRMDNPASTFKLLNEIAGSDVFNGIISFSSAVDAKEKLKLQIADFVGQRLGDSIAPMSNQIKDVLAEIKAIRNQLKKKTKGGDDSTKKYLVTTRYLLNDRVAEYRHLLEKVFGDIDTAIDRLLTVDTFDAAMDAAGYSVIKIPDSSFKSPDFGGPRPPKEDERRSIFATWNDHGGYKVFNTNEIEISETLHTRFNTFQQAIAAKLNAT